MIHTKFQEIIGTKHPIIQAGKIEEVPQIR